VKGGYADSGGKKEISLLILTGIESILFLVFLYSPLLIKTTPAKWLNLPNKDFWLKEENKPIAINKMENLMYEFGTVFLLLFLLIGILTLDANLSRPARLKEEIFLPFLIIFMVYVVYWCIRLFLAFRIPKDLNSK
jgi:glycerol uptake facilitator-like aquaporin